MPNRVRKLLPAIFGSVLAGLTLTAIPDTTVQAKDCLTAPGEPTQGGHWYYRIEYATKRHCWYVRAEGQGATAQLSSSAAKPAAPPASAALEQSVADARAEVAPAPEAAEPNNSIAPPTAPTIANDDVAPSDAQVLNVQSRTLAERWSDHPNADNPVEEAPANVVAGLRQQPQSNVAKPVEAPATDSVWMLVSALAGALALAGIATAVLANVGRGIPIESAEDRERYRDIWSAPPTDNISAPVDPRDEAALNWIRVARETQETNRRRDQTEQLLSQARGRTAV
jgi:hypothetical protein